MRRSTRRWSTIFATTLFMVGCTDRNPKLVTVTSDIGDEIPLIEPEASVFHFGHVIIKTNKKFEHPYRLLNSTNHPIKIVELVNRKPCCGEVQIGKTTLFPGEKTDAVVRLSINQEFGEVVHEVVVSTDSPRSEPIVLRTMATAHPAFRIEQSKPKPADGSTFLGSNEPLSVEFRVSSYGTLSDPPADLDHLKVRSTMKADWASSKTGDLSDGEFKVESRRMTAMLDLSGPPGQRQGEILLLDGEEVLLRHPAVWELVSSITSSPKMIVLKPESRDYRILLRSHGSKAFRITRIECSTAGIRARYEDTGPAPTHTIHIEVEVGLGDGSGNVTVFTDHPDQGRVELPFVMLR